MLVIGSRGSSPAVYGFCLRVYACDAAQTVGGTTMSAFNV